MVPEISGVETRESRGRGGLEEIKGTNSEFSIQAVKILYKDLPIPDSSPILEDEEVDGDSS